MKQLLAIVDDVACAVRAMLGVPDYERYLSHCQREHPNVKPMTRDQFASELMERKYNRPGSRCC